jgi:hypothetical protein
MLFSTAELGHSIVDVVKPCAGEPSAYHSWSVPMIIMIAMREETVMGSRSNRLQVIKRMITHISGRDGYKIPGKDNHIKTPLRSLQVGN